MEWAHDGYSIAEAAEWIGIQDAVWQRGDRFGFAIVDDESGHLLGAAGLNRFDPVHRTANLGYWVRTSAAGAGIGTRGVSLVAAYGLGEVGLHRIEIVAALENLPSRRVAEKAGAHFEGVARHRLFLHGERRDAAVYSVTSA